MRLEFALAKRWGNCEATRPLLCAVSSVVEHYLDTVGVRGSKPLPRTILQRQIGDSVSFNTLPTRRSVERIEKLVGSPTSEAFRATFAAEEKSARQATASVATIRILHQFIGLDDAGRRLFSRREIPNSVIGSNPKKFIVAAIARKITGCRNPNRHPATNRCGNHQPQQRPN